jgi:hypothetical protein
MAKLLAGLAVFGLAANAAAAETRYDRKIEQAALAIVASRMGELRGGFSFNAGPVFVMGSDAINTGSVAAPGGAASAAQWRDGVAPAVKGAASPSRF